MTILSPCATRRNPRRRRSPSASRSCWVRMGPSSPPGCCVASSRRGCVCSRRSGSRWSGSWPRPVSGRSRSRGRPMSSRQAIQRSPGRLRRLLRGVPSVIPGRRAVQVPALREFRIPHICEFGNTQVADANHLLCAGARGWLQGLFGVELEAGCPWGFATPHPSRAASSMGCRHFARGQNPEPRMVSFAVKLPREPP